ncbi:MAG: carnitine acyltransferase [Gammaproteobacteria bacterium]|nr:MAG: carnitine acyltransferase [Gammaproteobacteria bacterium]
MTLPRLPIPALNETAERYLTWVRPLLNDDDFSHTQQVVKNFVMHEGKQLQQDLRQFADQQACHDKSWLSDAWLDSYLNVRKSLPLSTSGAFRLDLDLPDNGLMRLAYLLVGMAKQSADYLSGQIAPNISPRGEMLDMRQWLSLRGIGRIPQPHTDGYEIAPMAKQARYIIVFWQGQAYSIPILDADYRLYSVTTVKNLLESITQDKPAADNMAVLSLAPAEQAVELYNELSEVVDNKHNFQLLAHSLFHVHLSPAAFADDADALRELTFLANEKLWAYKPMTICANVENNSYFVHLEHSSYDAGALQAMFARGEATAQDLASEQSPDFSTKTAELGKLHWQLNDRQRQALADLQQTHHEKAKNYQVSITTLDIDTKLIPERTSMDFLMQLPMQYAQLKTFGRIRNTYEAVDVSHFMAGRTECVRPVSSESVAFIRALSAGNADITGFNNAHQEHKNRIKACKRGHGVNRHLLGLQLMAQQRGIEPEIFNDKGYIALTNDFLSTSSLGDRRWIGDFAFTPTPLFTQGLHEGVQRLMAVFKNT